MMGGLTPTAAHRRSALGTRELRLGNVMLRICRSRFGTNAPAIIGVIASSIIVRGAAVTPFTVISAHRATSNSHGVPITR
jgi:hypothetical protein